MRTRRRRRDRNHILYRFDNVETGDFYIGLSAMIGRARLGTLKERFRRHVSKAQHEAKRWTLHKLLRKYPDAACWRMRVLKVVRGRKPAHQMERSLIRKHAPTLNTF
jgi:hypothetical protein